MTLRLSPRSTLLYKSSVNHITDSHDTASVTQVNLLYKSSVNHIADSHDTASVTQLLNRIPCAAMDSVKMESVQIKEEFPELEPVPIRVEFSGLASLPIKQELCEMQCDSSQPEVSEIKAEHNELEIPQTEEPLPVKQEEVLETVRIKQEPPEVEFDHMEPVKEESEDFKPNIPELEPVRLRECSVVLERICVREQGAGEEGSPNSTQGGGKEDGRSHSECSLAGE
ncbi:UNVERIFIED_CONTAM: hypothetical protein FKN15_039106 [Acipenser sinensis]